MSNVQAIERAVRQLSEPELAEFRIWFAEFDAEAWDKQIAADVSAGRLDRLVDDALRAACEGRCTDL